MLNFKEYKDKKEDSIQEMVYSIIFNLITDIPDSLLCPNGDPDKRAETLIKQAALKAATVSTSLSIPAGFIFIIISIVLDSFILHLPGCDRPVIVLYAQKERNGSGTAVSGQN